MSDADGTPRPLTRTQAQGAVEHIGWRYLLGALHTAVPVDGVTQAAEVTATAVLACGPDADGHLRVDLRPGRVELRLQTQATADVTTRDTELAAAVRDAVQGLGLGLAPLAGPHSVQSLEIGIDALDIPAVRPFWKAVLAYADDPADGGPTGALVDPLGQGPAVWFQQMDAPRPQRNRVHLDVTVPHDEADARVQAALDAGGTLLSDARARAFWVLADPEGNEACVCTWEDRDRPAGPTG
ncbi:VOC family protein [Thalassiella azotivora]